MGPVQWVPASSAAPPPPLTSSTAMGRTTGTRIRTSSAPSRGHKGPVSCRLSEGRRQSMGIHTNAHSMGIHTSCTEQRVIRSQCLAGFLKGETNIAVRPEYVASRHGKARRRSSTALRHYSSTPAVRPVQPSLPSQAHRPPQSHCLPDHTPPPHSHHCSRTTACPSPGPGTRPGSVPGNPQELTGPRRCMRPSRDH